jgi:hypothetical protein
MLEYCDPKAREELIKIIYHEFEQETKQTISYVEPKLEAILRWEDFRCKWLVKNIGNPLKEAKSGK